MDGRDRRWRCFNRVKSYGNIRFQRRLLRLELEYPLSPSAVFKALRFDPSFSGGVARLRLRQIVSSVPFFTRQFHLQMNDLPDVVVGVAGTTQEGCGP